MKTFLQLSAQRRRNAYNQVDEEMGLQAASVEKDFWVCWTLRELFTLSEVGEHLTFKGGTSLSKAWRLIERFSEDIDVILKRERGIAGSYRIDGISTSSDRLRINSMGDRSHTLESFHHNG